MLDKLHLFVPFRLEHIQLLGVEGRADPVHVVDLESLGVPLQGQISRGRAESYRLTTCGMFGSR
ncbi:hypothetical protein CSB90_3522 [Pseudomonas aeruginosa]|nr:hypothetical protein [Pseudomonas aeruginosa]AVK18198.1 hypothetical protein CSB90_3522 [Pseudomonas aeruginosa]